jgi:nitroreductase
VEFIETVGRRRTIRWFKTWEPVPRDKIQRILEVARMSTCPGNLQPWRAVVVERDQIDAETRDQLLTANNYQGAHTQAPVWIYWYADPDMAVPETFKARVRELIDFGALPPAYGWTMDAVEGMIDRAEVGQPGLPALETLVHGLPYEISALVAAQETNGAVTQATLAAVNEGLGAALHMIASPPQQEIVKKLLGVPERCVPVWVLLVGYPAEDSDAGGPRPRLPFEELFFFGHWGTSFPRDPEVVTNLEREGLRQPGPAKANRSEELKALARMFGYPI